jgi:hypothetical protein
MALVRGLRENPRQRDARHKEVDGTFSWFKTDEGYFLQIDTYGSKDRNLRGNKS